ncbi:MAG TPA: M23 family metallopeptidase [Anaerolineae bacterium]|nr:M23 family metallopeptidase [Anaerolineae bacterium]
MTRKRETRSLTLMIVPHSERPPVALRIPIWLIPVSATALSLLVLSLFFLALSNRSLHGQLTELNQGQSIHEAREQDMRLTILAQQDEVTTLSQSVERFKAGMLEVEKLSHQIRELIGLQDAEVAATVVPTSSGAQGGQGGFELGDYSMSLAVEADSELGELESLLPQSAEELSLLLAALNARVERIAPEKRQDPQGLEWQLRLIAAAPKRWPLKGEITSGFGYRVLPEGGRLEFHQAVDIGAWYGTPVYATKAGKVVFAGWRPGLGWTVVLEHEMGFSTVYGHNSWYFVDPGDGVEEGQRIALSGDSGRSTGPHLHYEIQLEGVPVDPMIYLSLGEE